MQQYMALLPECCHLEQLRSQDCFLLILRPVHHIHSHFELWMNERTWTEGTSKLFNGAGFEGAF